MTTGVTQVFALLRALGALTAAVALHGLALWVAIVWGFGAPEHVAGAGAGGIAQLSVEAATPDLMAQVAAWDRPNPVADAPKPPSPPVEVPPPDPVATPAPTPIAPTPTTAPEQIPKPTPLPRPQKAPAAQPKPKPAAKPSADAQPARPAERARGTGGGAASGTEGAATTAQGKDGASGLRAAWAGGVRAAIERKKTYPQAAGQATGAVALRLSMTGTGALVAVDVVTSSGNVWLDRAAVDAARMAAPYAAPPAGAGLDAPRLTVTIRFTR